MIEPAPLDALVGRAIDGTYRLERLLGRGGMGAVFEATHLRTGGTVAVKVLLPRLARHHDSVPRFEREARAVASLGHANIVSVHDFRRAEGLVYLVMDRLEGEDLAARIEAGPMPLAEVLQVVRGVSAGLHAAHSAGLVHRDLKPANIFLARQAGSEERPVILDFGLVKSFAEEAVEEALTRSGAVMGTPAYMSPEQASGQPLDHRTDLYSLACIVFEMLSGRPPYDAPTAPALFAILLTEPPPRLSAVLQDPSTDYSALDRVLERALAKSPGQRFPDAPSFLAALEAGIGATHPATEARHGTVPGPDARPASAPASLSNPRGLSYRARWGVLSVLAVAAFCVLGALVGLTLFFYRPTASPHISQAPAPTPPAAPIEPAAPVTPEPDTTPASRRAIETTEPARPLETGPVPSDEIAPARPTTARATTARATTGTPAAAPRTARRRRTLARSAPPPVAPVAPAGPPNAAAPGFNPATDRRDPVVRATEYSRTGDYRGCIRELRAARPTTMRILHARFACASSARDPGEIRDVCDEIMRRNPADPMVPACNAMATRPAGR